ncbi:MAG: tetratricopeptide repeat protein [Cytophagales bacterium]|nr:tetratricopeptide repeat protein [Cytophagales bacterium]
MKTTTERNNKGVEHLLKKEFSKAEAEFTASLEMDSTNSTALNNMGLLHHQKRNYEKAADLFEKAIAITKKDTYYLNLGNALTFLKKYGEAEFNYMECLKINGQNENAKISLAKLYESTGKPELATKIWEELTTSSARGLYKAELARNYMATGNFERALSVLSYLNSVREDALNLCYTGVCEFNLKNYGLAESAFKKSLAIEPDNDKTRHYLAINHLSKGDYDSAIRELNSLIRMHPENSKVKLDKATILLNLGRYGEASDLIKAVLSADPENKKAIRYQKVVRDLLKDAPDEHGK